MNQCPNCQVLTDEQDCPLCDLPINEGPGEKMYPNYDREAFEIRSRIRKLAIFGGILATIICLVINIVVMPQYLWVFYVAVGIFYLLVSLNHTILSGSHLGGKITAQVISLTVVLLVIDGMSGEVQWSVNYVVPFLIIAGILLITVMIVKVGIRWTGYISFLLLLITFGFLPLVLYFSNVATVLWPSVTAAAFAAATFTIMLLFGNQKFMTQLSRRFHF